MSWRSLPTVWTVTIEALAKLLRALPAAAQLYNPLLMAVISDMAVIPDGFYQNQMPLFISPPHIY